MFGKFLGSLILLVISSQVPLFGQADPAEANNPTKVSVVKHGWSASGQLVLAVEIEAGSKTVALGSINLGAASGSEATAFSMAGSTLTDAYSGQTFPALNSLPRRPFYGTMAAITQLPPRSSATFGVAFPHPPDPPLDEKGNQQPYKFKLQLPQDMSVEFTFPFEQRASPPK